MNKNPIGRPRVYDADTEVKIIELYNAGNSFREIMQVLEIASTKTIYDILHNNTGLLIRDIVYRKPAIDTE